MMCTMRNMARDYPSLRGIKPIEGYIGNEEITMLLEMTNSSDPKRALGFLYYDYKSEQEKFVKSLSRETLENLSDPINRINNL